MNERNKVALITGKTNKDSIYLAESLLEKVYKVNGLKRYSSSFNSSRIDDIYRDLFESNARFSAKRICLKTRCFLYILPKNNEF